MLDRHVNRHPRTPALALRPFEERAVPVATCEVCGKQGYRSRRKAKAAARALYPGHHMSAYRCGQWWHVGHLPSRMIAGDHDRYGARVR